MLKQKRCLYQLILAVDLSGGSATANISVKPGQIIHYSGPRPTRTQEGAEPGYPHIVILE